MPDRYCTPDTFAKTLEEIIGEVPKGIEGQMPGLVSESAQLGRRHLLRNIGASGIKEHNGRYRAGWATRRKQTAGHKWEARIYNKEVPGLPHLLEKGHAKVGGGRVAGHDHIAPAAEDAFDDFERRVERAVGRL